MPGLCSWKMSGKSKSPKSKSKFQFRTMYVLGVRGLTTPSYTVYDRTTSGHMDLWTMYIQYIHISIQYTYISIPCLYLFLMQKNVRNVHSFWYGSFTHNCGSLGTQTNTLVCDLALPLILPALSRAVYVLLWAILTSRHISRIRSPFSHQLIACNFSSVPIFFRQFYIWIALGGADLCFSLLLVRGANAVKEQTKWDTAYIINVITPYTWLMVWQWCYFPLASYRR
jgi:hypothetical protein